MADDWADYVGALPQAYQSAFEGFAARCALAPNCPLGADTATAAEHYHALVLPLLDAPRQSLQNPSRRLSYDNVVAGTLFGLSEQTGWDELIYALIVLGLDKPDPMLELADRWWGRDADGDYAYVAANVLQCVDGEPDPVGAEGDQFAAELVSTAPFLDNGDPPRAVGSLCQSWSSGSRFEMRRPVPGTVPTVVIAIRGDIVVPYQVTSAAAKNMGAVLLTVEQTGHTRYLFRTSPCVDESATAFLVSGTPPAEDTTCS